VTIFGVIGRSTFDTGVLSSLAASLSSCRYSDLTTGAVAVDFFPPTIVFFVFFLLKLFELLFEKRERSNEAETTVNEARRNARL
jgi:hypothetical protein